MIYSVFIFCNFCKLYLLVPIFSEMTKSGADILNSIFEAFGENPNSFATNIGLNRAQTIYDILNGKTQRISLNLVNKINEAYPSINRSYLLTGEGDMLHHGNKLHSSGVPGDFYKALPMAESVSKKRADSFIGVPMYNIPASASLVEMYGDANDVKIVGHLTIPGATKDSFALPVHGHSMYPTLENGSWCVLRPLNDKTDIEWGEIYYIEYGDYRMYKRLLKVDDEDSVMLWSDNQTEIINNRPKYAAKVIKKEKIRRLCLLTDILKKPNY